MVQITLSQYHKQIEQMIEESRLAESVAHCQHILHQYPRHLNTYRLLGKILLDQQNFEEANEIFQRILSAYPEDFIAHAGLALIYKACNSFEPAIWHMERAFEIDPYNTIVQEELKVLYKERDGVAPDRLTLTKGALARLHSRSGMYPQAINELNTLLKASTDRIDLETLLAETLWRDDQRVDAVKICLDVLGKLPNNVKANAILAEIWLLTGRIEEASTYLKRLHQLTLLDEINDLESPIGRAFHTEGAISLPNQIFVNELNDSVVLQSNKDDVISADWINQLDQINNNSNMKTHLNWFDDNTVSTQEETSLTPHLVSEFEDVPEWLLEMDDSDSQLKSTQNQASLDKNNLPDINSSSSEDIPSWLGEIEDIQDEPYKNDMNWFSNGGIVPESLEPAGLEPIIGFTDWFDKINDLDQHNLDYSNIPLKIPTIVDPQLNPLSQNQQDFSDWFVDIGTQETINGLDINNSSYSNKSLPNNTDSNIEESLYNNIPEANQIIGNMDDLSFSEDLQETITQNLDGLDSSGLDSVNETNESFPSWLEDMSSYFEEND